MRIRTDKSANYRAVFVNGQTIRTPIDPSKPITELAFPEFYDVSFGTKCSGGCDTVCYASALKNGVHYTRLAEKIEKFFGVMTDNQRPTQVACGGSAESLENPECFEALAAFHRLNIVPNLTTNAMFINNKTIPKILEYCMGIAVTCHPHLETLWRRAIGLLAGQTRLNVHVIISDAESSARFVQLYKELADKVEYFVLLRHMNVGHAAKNPKVTDFEALARAVDPVYKEGKLAFGANFYPWLKKNRAKYNVSIYPPEIMSKYLLLNDELSVYNNSFDMRPVPFSPEAGCELGHARSTFE